MCKRIRPTHKLTFLTFGILFIALEFLLWSICGVRFWNIGKPNYNHSYIVDIIYTCCAVAVIATTLIIYIAKTYYVIEENQITRYGFKMKAYRFNNIVYLDEDYSLKHVDIKFYDNSGYWVFLTDNRKKDLYKIIKEKSPLLSLEKFKDKYPKVEM